MSFLTGALWVLTLKTASVAGCHAVRNVGALVVAWSSRLSRPKKREAEGGRAKEASSTVQDEPENLIQCVDEIGTAIVSLNDDRVPRLGEGWGVSIAFGMLGSIGVFVMILPEVIKNWRAADSPMIYTAFSTLLGTFFGALPLVLVSLPAAVTDKCIELEACLSKLFIPAKPGSKTKERFVVSFEASQQLEILEKFMQRQNNKQGSAFRSLGSRAAEPSHQLCCCAVGFVIFGQVCSRRFSWQFFVLAAAVLT